MLLFSIPAFLMLLWVGNFVELRIFNEFVYISGTLKPDHGPVFQ